MRRVSASGQHHHRRSRGRRWSIAARRRLAVFVGGAALILVAAIAVPIVLSGGASSAAAPPSSTPPTAVASMPSSPASAAATFPVVPSALPTGSAGPSNAPLTHPVVATRLIIKRLGIDLPIVEGDGVDAPLYKVAHYPGSSWPGGGTNIYLYAHARTGMFLSLWKAKVGDQVVLDLANGMTRTYVVTKILPKVAWNDMQVVAPTPQEQLTLQTCTSYQETAPRFLVIAVPVT